MLLVGDNYTGKTAQIQKFMNPNFVVDDTLPATSEAAVLDLRERYIRIYDARIKAQLQDTPGDRGFIDIRSGMIDKSDVVMICFAVDQALTQDDTAEVVRYWVTEVRNTDPKKPIVFVLTKKDLLPGEPEDKPEEGFNLNTLYDYMIEHQVQMLMQTSAKKDEIIDGQTQFSVEQVFTEAFAIACKYKFGLQQG